MPRPDPPADVEAGSRLAALGLTPALRGWVPDQSQGDAADRSSSAAAHPLDVPTSSSPASAWLSLRDRLPPSWQAVTAAPSRAALAALALVCALCVGITALTLAHRRPALAEPPLPPPPATAVTPAGIVVDVGGRVRHPGLVTLPAGSRVADALRAAGGALRPADLATVDLAARVTDGQLLLIGVPAAAAGTAGGAPGSGDGPVDLNTATLDQLDGLPGVGPVLAQHIVDWRETHGGFRTVDDLQDVPGIGPAKLAELRPLVAV